MHTSDFLQPEVIDQLFSPDSFEDIYQLYLAKRLDKRTGHPRAFPGYEGVSLRSLRNKKFRYQLFASSIRKFHQLRFTFNPYASVRREKRGGGERTISMCGARDYVVQHAAAQFLTYVYEPLFLPCSFAYRPNLGPKKATRQVRDYVASGYSFFLIGDIKEFFDKIDHEILLKQISESVFDERVMKVLFRYLRTPSVEKAHFASARNRIMFPSNKIGVPQGGVLSGILSNIYLNGFDNEVSKAFPNYVRYADNFLIAVASLDEANDALRLVKDEASKLRLEIHSEPKTQIQQIHQRFDFLGFHHGPDKLSPSTDSVARLKQRMETILWAPSTLNWSRDLDHTIWRLNRVIEGDQGLGWGAYYCLSDDVGVFKRLDKWLVTQLIHVFRTRHGQIIDYNLLKARGLRSLVNGYYRRFKFAELSSTTEVPGDSQSVV
jgi:group II intron reverse transcriptase/maturase